MVQCTSSYRALDASSAIPIDLICVIGLHAVQGLKIPSHRHHSSHATRLWQVDGRVARLTV